ncbi:MAG: HPr family phosphocarrier protein [Clostridia bacterium]|nr:HPr family phosphocarrier protein [Clostridia bacterium]
MKKAIVTIENQSGLHARPASSFVAVAQKFESEIQLAKDGNAINAKSIIGILGLGVSLGDQVEIIAEGNDEVEAVEALVHLVNEELKHQ